MSKKNIIFWVGIIALAIVGRFFYFWIIIPALFGILVFYSIQFYKSKNYLVYPSILLGTLLFCFSAGELYFWKPIAQNDTESTPSVEYLGIEPFKSNWYADPVLGYGPKAMVSKTSSRRMRGDEVVYDVQYTTDEKGRRVTPDNHSTADTLILLFGCSFTFGESLNDQETFAWQLSELLGPKFQVYNYGFHGYGSHQMLALLESGRLDELKNKYQNVYTYYLSFPDIERRSAGIDIWNEPGVPRYVLDENGSVRHTGTFRGHEVELRGKSAQSQLLKKILEIYMSRQPSIELTDEYIHDLHAEIIKSSSQILQDTLENKAFVAVVYPDYDTLKTRLEGSNIDIVDLDNYFKDFSEEKYTIPHDSHPNYEATKIIAKAYYEDVLKQVKKSTSQ